MDIVFELSIIIISTAVLCFMAEIAKQPLIAAYILAGLIVGPLGFNLIEANGFFTALSQVGIILLLYLIGLELKPAKLGETLKKSYRISMMSVLALVPIGLFIGWVSGLTQTESIYLSIALLFSSTVVVLKTMHDERGTDPNVYESCIGILLIQDMLAVIVLLVINSFSSDQGLTIYGALRFIIQGALFIAFAFLFQRYALRKMIKKVIERTDLVFLIGLAWCFFLAEFAEVLQLSREIGGFIAGLSLTSLPIRKLTIIVTKSETIRDFFMILFFFVLGANLRLEGLEIYTLAIALALGAIVFLKPIIFYFSARRTKHTIVESKEIGLRLGQNSEFSIIVAGAAVASGQITMEFAMAIQIILFISIILSNYVVKFYPSRS